MGTTWLQKEERWQRCVGGLIHRDNRGAEGRHNDVTPPLSVDAVWLNSGCLRWFFLCRGREKFRLWQNRTVFSCPPLIHVIRRSRRLNSQHLAIIPIIRPSHPSLLVFELAEICTEKKHTNTPAQAKIVRLTPFNNTSRWSSYEEITFFCWFWWRCGFHRLVPDQDLADCMHFILKVTEEKTQHISNTSFSFLNTVLCRMYCSEFMHLFVTI